MKIFLFTFFVTPFAVITYTLLLSAYIWYPPALLIAELTLISFENSNDIGFKTSPKTLIVFGFLGIIIVSPSNKIVLIEALDFHSEALKKFLYYQCQKKDYINLRLSKKRLVNLII